MATLPIVHFVFYHCHMITIAVIQNQLYMHRNHHMVPQLLFQEWNTYTIYVENIKYMRMSYREAQAASINAL